MRPIRLTTGMSTTPTPRTGSLIAVALTIVLAVAVVGYTMLGPMACDSCAGATLEAFERRYWTAVVAVAIGLLLATVLLVAGRVVARGRNASRAIVLIWLAPMVVAVAGVLALVLIRP